MVHVVESYLFCISHSHNILLDEGCRGYLADFGFATALPVQHGTTCVVTAVGAVSLAGTRGYLAPEFSDGKHGVKSDVYSYGIVSYVHMYNVILTSTSV